MTAQGYKATCEGLLVLCFMHTYIKGIEISYLSDTSEGGHISELGTWASSKGEEKRKTAPSAPLAQHPDYLLRVARLICLTREGDSWSSSPKERLVLFLLSIDKGSKSTIYNTVVLTCIGK